MFAACAQLSPYLFMYLHGFTHSNPHLHSQGRYVGDQDDIRRRIEGVVVSSRCRNKHDTFAVQ